MKYVISGIIGLVIFVVSAKFTANSFEKSIVYSFKDNENVYNTMNKIMKASGLTVENFGETKIKAIREEVMRYADKPQMMMQFVKENPQQIDSKIWEQFMSQYERNSVSIMNSQRLRFSKAQAYDEWLGSSVKGFIASNIFSYPILLS